MKTLTQILRDVNSYIDLEDALPTGEDLNVRINYAKQAVDEWAASYRWRQLKQTTTVTPTGATISLATNFRQLTYPPQSGSIEFPEIQPEERHAQASGDQYCYVWGGVSDYSLIVNGLSSGGEISFDWQRYPSNFATLSSICEVPDPSFVRLRVQSLILQSRLDSRFQTIDVEAQRVLNNMIGRENNLRPGGSSSIKRSGAGGWKIGKHRGV